MTRIIICFLMMDSNSIIRLSTSICFRISTRKTSRPIRISLFGSGSVLTVPIQPIVEFTIFAGFTLLGLFWVPFRSPLRNKTFLSTGLEDFIMPRDKRPQGSVMSMIVFWLFWSCLRFTQGFFTWILMSIMGMESKRLSLTPIES